MFCYSAEIQQKTLEVQELYTKMFSHYVWFFDYLMQIFVLKKTNKKCQSTKILQAALDLQELQANFYTSYVWSYDNFSA